MIRRQSTGKPAPLDRFNAFSDGVFAIAITILVLELPVPEGNTQILPALGHDWPAFLGYFVSFSIIGGVWIQHASLTRLMRSGDTPSYVMNLLLLLFVGLLPFSTKLMVNHLGQDQVGVAVLVYGINILLASVTLSFLMMYVAANDILLVDDVADHELRGIYVRRWGSIAINAVALFLAFIAPNVAIALYLLQSLLLLAIPLFGFRIRRAKTSA